MAVPNIFGSATAAIPLSQLDTNFATPVTIGNTAVQLGNTVTSFGNVTLTNVTISSGNVTITGANVSGTANVSTLVVTGSETVSGNTAVTGNITASFFTSTSTFGFKNRIINGAMVIDQRNAGASVTPTDGSYTLDRWLFQLSQASKLTMQQNAGSVTPPTGYVNYLGITSSSAYSIGAGDYFGLQQRIEGLNCADFGWGTAGASPITISFWVRSSLTGTFGGSVRNSAANRSYPFSYVINSANTWEQKSITIAGDTSGTWLTTNGIGMYIQFGLGVGSTYSNTAGAWVAGNYSGATGATSVVGTNGATFYITGVQLEKGSTATSFDYRPYGTELQLCYRYFYKWLNDAGYTAYVTNLQAYSTTAAFGKILDFPVTMRTTPACVTSGTFGASNSTGGTSIAFTTTVIDFPTKNSFGTGGWTGSSGLVAGNMSVISLANNAFITANAEL